MSSYWGRDRERRERTREEVEVVVVERIETRLLPLVIWTRRVCPFCGSDRIEVTGTKQGGELRYYLCEACRQSFRVKEQ